MAGPLSEWPHHLDRCREMGFDFLASGPLFAPGGSRSVLLTADHEKPNPALQQRGDADEIVRILAQACRERDLGLILDFVVDRVAVDSRLAADTALFRCGRAADRIDPRSELPRADAAYARFDDPTAVEPLTRWLVDRLGRLVQAQAAGFRCLYPNAVPADIWRTIIDGVRRQVNPGRPAGRQ
jgi:starch synthase (maltosyl-transferring)